MHVFLVLLFIFTDDLRGDFLQSRVFFSKSAKNLATRPSRKNAAPLGFKSFSKFAKKNNRILLDFWLYHEAKHCQI
jgi:hypothetical protein